MISSGPRSIDRRAGTKDEIVKNCGERTKDRYFRIFSISPWTDGMRYSYIDIYGYRRIGRPKSCFSKKIPIMKEKEAAERILSVYCRLSWK
jgi:hypothetical protein